MALRFGPFQFHPDDGSLLRDGADVPLPPRATDTLSCLLAQAGKVVTKDALIDAVWGQAHVSDTALKEAVFLIRRALDDDPKRPSYVQTVHRRGYRFVAPVETEVPAEPSLAAAATAVKPSLRQRTPWLLLGAALVLAVAFSIVNRSGDPDPAVVIRATLEIPSTHELLPVGLALSADGSQVAYVGKDGGRRLYLRRLESDGADLVAGSEGAQHPFFSPDGRWLGFFADGALKVVPVEGGTPRTLAPAPVALGGTWLAEGAIVYAGQEDGGLRRVAVDGGAPELVSHPDPEVGERSHRWPETLPGTQGVLYTDWRGSSETSRIARLDLVTGESSVLLEGGSRPRYLSPGYLLYSLGGQVMATRYDVRETTVPDIMVSVLDGLEASTARGAVELAVGSLGGHQAVAVYTPERTEDLRLLEWLEVDGSRQPVPAVPARYQSLALDSGGGRAALTVADGTGSDVWIVNLEDGGPSRLTFDGRSGYPVWTPDGASVVYSSFENGEMRLLERDAEAQGAVREILPPGALCLALRVTADGRLIYIRQDPETSRWTLRSVPLDASAEPEVMFAPDTRVRSMTPSVDGAWLAYEALTGSAWEIRLRRLDGGAGVWQVSLGGGSEPRWDSTGRLYYRVADGVARLTVTDGRRLEASSREAFFPLDDAEEYLPGVEDGKLLVLRSFSQQPRHLSLILGWEVGIEARLNG